ncbi:ribosomal protein L2 [Acaromyces ingoldii]|uniref:Large ribosomal subunit protein uL2m n=1 Tax=Acaromyces ingoldii TaxID=215250 RepID=A0A316YWU4_9BASI|nr:ribosomal protein L2 [Acaromyces ingoldii]PWN92265.1 ribosomal protein L2 [Acaromyces ingoldii]
MWQATLRHAATSGAVLSPRQTFGRATAGSGVRTLSGTAATAARLASSSQVVVGVNNGPFPVSTSVPSPPSSPSVLGASEQAAALLGPISRRERRAAQKERRKEALKRKAGQSIFARMGVSSEKVSPYVRKDRQFKTFKPLTPSLRWVRTALNPHLHKGGPERGLTVAKRAKGGRNHHGRLTVRGVGGGHRRRIRMVDFERSKPGEQKVLRIEYDPGRSAHIALIEHQSTKVKSYILAPEGLREGDVVQSYRHYALGQSDAVGSGDLADSGNSANSSLNLGIFRTKAIKPGNVLPLKMIPIGTTIHAISLMPEGPAKLVRSAGAYGQLVAFVNRSKAKPTAASADDDANPSPEALMLEERAEAEAAASSSAPKTHAQVKLQSGEVRLVLAGCCATIGRVSNADHEHERLGKAGRSRWLGRRPKVRGVAMNAVDHPHGGGRGKSKSNMHPRSIYGQKTKGPRTRKPGTKNGNQMVVRERPRRNGKRAGKP